MDVNKTFSTLATKTSKAAGSPWAFGACVLLVVAWAVSGPMFKFSETWQLVINTGTTIVTFLMVFLIQNTQNREGAAIQAKLDELILSSAAENEFIGIEKLTDKELEGLQAKCARAAQTHGRLAERVGAELSSRAKRGGKKTRAAAAPKRRPRTAKRSAR
jgi:low affinity Fe/Cu permease